VVQDLLLNVIFVINIFVALVLEHISMKPKLTEMEVKLLTILQRYTSKQFIIEQKVFRLKLKEQIYQKKKRIHRK
jgi:hypothetical protein